MKILQVVSSISNESAGPTYSVQRLCDSLAVSRVDVSLHVLAPLPKARSTRAYPVLDYPMVPIIERLGMSPAMNRALRMASREADIIHSHGLWMMPNIYAGRASASSGCRLVVSPRGMLSAWAIKRSRWKKRLILSLGQRQALHAAACVHATAQSEYVDSRKFGLSMPVAIIPNGIDVPAEADISTRGNGRRRLLFLGRIHPKKGIDVLLRAWRNVQQSFDDWELWIVGPDNDGYLEKMRRLADELGLKRVTFAGPYYGEAKSGAYAASDLFVLPTHSENWGITVAEALAHGVPAIVTYGAPWSGLQTYHCGWWIERSEESLTDCLRTALSESVGSLATKGARGREWMKRDYSWELVGQMMLQTYQWMLNGGRTPEWIRAD